MRNNHFRPRLVHARDWLNAHALLLWALALGPADVTALQALCRRR